MAISAECLGGQFSRRDDLDEFHSPSLAPESAADSSQTSSAPADFGTRCNLNVCRLPDIWLCRLQDGADLIVVVCSQETLLSESAPRRTAVVCHLSSRGSLAAFK